MNTLTNKIMSDERLTELFNSYAEDKRIQEQFGDGDYANESGDIMSIISEVKSLRAQLASLPADWSKDSSLETWFPLSAEHIARLEAQLAELRGQEPEQIRWRWKAMTYPSGITTHPMVWTNVEKKDFGKIADILKRDEVEHQELFARPVPPAASQPVSSKTIECWSCKKALTLQQRLDADGMCPHCDAEIELESDASASQPYTAPDEITKETATIIAWGLPTTNIGAIFKAGYDRCRAAMLQSQPVSKPDTLPDIDSKALELSRQVMALIYGPMPKGGSVQLQAKIQCLFADALAGNSLVVPIRYMNRITGQCFTLEQQPDAATDTDVYIPLVPVCKGE